MHQADSCHINRDKIKINLKKAQSHLAKIQTMVDDGAYCVDTMSQNLAVIGLLKSAHQMLMEDHLQSCFSAAIKSSDEDTKSRMIGEILTVSKLVNK